MTFLKLNFHRFKTKIEELYIDVGINDTNVSSGAKNVETAFDKVDSAITKVIDSQDRMTTSSGNMSRYLTNMAKTSLADYRNTINQMKSLMGTPEASSKFKIDAGTTLKKLDLTGGLEQVPSQMNMADINRVLSATNTQLKKNATEYERQSKLIEKQIADEDNLIAKEKERQTVIEQMVNALQQVEAQKIQASVPLTPFQQLGKAVQGYSNFMNAAEGYTSKFKAGLGSAIKTVTGAAVRFRILYGVFRQITGVLANTVQEAASYEEALNLYTVALGEYAQEASEWANRISTALYLDPKNVMQYTGALYNLVQGLGVSADAAYIMSTNLTQLAYDMSSYLNIDVEAAYTKLQSAMTGQSRAVASAGIAMQQASLQELAYSMGIRQNVADMTQAEKTYLRYIQIMRSTANMQGDLARTIITPENALRVIQQQFTMLARAIGQVFIPIIMKAIPYVMAFTQALMRLASALGAKLGYKVADIDYSGLKTLDTTVKDTFKDIGVGSGKAAKSTGSAAKSMKDSINDALAAFDDLNTVQTEVTSGGGGGGVGGIGGGGVGGIGGLGGIPWDDYLTGYDMLEGLTDHFSKKVAEASENLKKLWNWIKAIAAIWATWKILKGVNDLIKFSQGLIDAYHNGTGLMGVIGKLVTAFKTNYAAATELGYTGLGAVVQGFRNMIGPIGQSIGLIGSMVAAFVLGRNAMKDWDGTTKDMIGNIAKATIEIGLMTAAGALFAGTAGAIGVAAIGVTGAVVGLAEAIDDYQKSLVKEQQYNELFDGVGVSVNALSTSFQSGVTRITEYGETMDNLRNRIDNTENNVKEASDSFSKLHNSILLGTADGDIIERLTNATEQYKKAVNSNRDAQIEYHNTVLANLEKEGIINKKEYEKMTANAREHYTKMALYESQYADDLRKLDAQLQQGVISQDEYNKKVDELASKYAGVITPIDNAGEHIAALYLKSAEKIDLKNPEELKKLVENLKKSFDEGTESIKQQKSTYIESIDAEREATQGHISQIEGYKKIHGELSKEQTDALESYKQHLADLDKERKDSLKGFKQSEEELTNTYANYLTTIYAQIAQSGAGTQKEIKGTVNTITSELNNLSSFDVSKSVYDLFGNLTNTFQKRGKTFGEQTMNQFGAWGISFSDELYFKLLYGEKEGHKKHIEYTNSSAKEIRDLWADNGTRIGSLGGEKIMYSLKEGLVANKNGVIVASNETGKNIDEGMAKGMNDNINKVKDSSKKVSDNAINTAKSTLGIHSPSTVFQTFGLNIVEGLNKGINDNKNSVINTINNLVNSIKSKLNDTKISLKINTNVESSFNAILSKLQTFINSWRSSINKMLENTKSSLNSVSVNKSNKVTYSSFGAVSVPKFAQGGYPTSGDLFFANENGVPEYITSIGNRSAVINQEQMVSALSNAIITGISNLNMNNQTGDIVVNIGNEQVYRSAIKYINRQRNIYGTNVV